MAWRRESQEGRNSRSRFLMNQSTESSPMNGLGLDYDVTASASRSPPRQPRQPAAGWPLHSPLSLHQPAAVSDLARLDLAHDIPNKAKSNKKTTTTTTAATTKSKTPKCRPRPPPKPPSRQSSNPRPPSCTPPNRQPLKQWVCLTCLLDPNKTGESEEMRPKADSSNHKDPQKPHPISMESDVALRGGRSDVCPGRFCFCVPCPIPCDFCII